MFRFLLCPAINKRQARIRVAPKRHIWVYWLSTKSITFFLKFCEIPILLWHLQAFNLKRKYKVVQKLIKIFSKFYDLFKHVSSEIQLFNNKRRKEHFKYFQSGNI